MSSRTHRAKIVFLVSRRIPKCFAPGFTLIELMITVGIFALLTTVTVVNFRAIDSNITLDSVAQRIAAEIRRAQIYGISVAESSGAYPGYGVSFSSASPSQFILFADTTPNKQYDCSGELVETVLVERGGIISKLCGDMKTLGSNPDNCFSINRLDISFLRPNPEATLLDGLLTSFSDAEIILVSPNGTKKTVVIWTTGQISVE